VLSGGGSRGAYEAGIIHYLRTDLKKRLGRHVPIDIVTGTSVGAINAAFLAATQHDPASQAEQMVSAWRALRIEELIGLRTRDVLRAGKIMLGADPPPPPPGSFRYGGLLDTSGLEVAQMPNRRREPDSIVSSPFYPCQRRLVKPDQEGFIGAAQG
jgi:NTE family protein